MTDNWYQDWKSRPLIERLEKLPRGLGVIETVDLCREAAAALREAENAAYEQGYAEGGSSARADFYIAVSEFTDAEQGESDSPLDVIRKVEAAAYEKAAQVAMDTMRDGFWDDPPRVAEAIRALKDKGE